MPIRPATEADAEAITAIYNEGIDDRVATFETRPRERDEVAAWISDPLPALVATDGDGAILGFARVAPYSDRCVYAGVGEHAVYVARAARGRQVGRRLLEALAAASERAGIYKLTSRVFADNAASRAVHLAAGFREVGIQRRHGRLDGEWKDCVLVERLLGEALSPTRLPVQRLARTSDAPRIAALMRASILDLFPHFYDARQTASAAVHIGDPDLSLIEDGTYFVHEAGGEIVACGGWSRRDRLYTGSGAREDDGRRLDPRTEPARVRAMFVRPDWTRRGLGRAILDACERAARAEGFSTLALMATLPGEPLYRAFGFRELERVEVTLADGVVLAGVAMERPISG